MKHKKVLGVAAVVFGLLVALIPKVIFPVCTDTIELINGKNLYMRCHWTAVAEFVIGVLILFDGILILIFKDHETRIALSVILFLLGLATILFPTLVIGMCEAETMKCRMGTEPALIAAGVLVMVISLGSVLSQISLLRSEKLQKERSVAK